MIRISGWCGLIVLCLLGTPTALLYSRDIVDYKIGQDLLGLFIMSRLSDSAPILNPKDPSRCPVECLSAGLLCGVVP
jgi:hypothetical protein